MSSTVNKPTKTSRSEQLNFYCCGAAKNNLLNDKETFDELAHACTQRKKSESVFAPKLNLGGVAGGIFRGHF